MANSQFNDYDIACDTLDSMKRIITYYTTFCIEASHSTLQNKLIGLQKELYEAQHELFELMYEKNWYPVTPETAEKLNETKTLLKKRLDLFE